MTFIVYILYSEGLDKYYIGFTGDLLDERIRRHLSSSKGFTAKTKDWKLVYKEIFNNKPAAMLREKEIKSWKSRTRIQAIIRTNE